MHVTVFHGFDPMVNAVQELTAMATHFEETLSEMSWMRNDSNTNFNPSNKTRIRAPNDVMTC